MKDLLLIAIILMSSLFSFSQNSAPVAMGETVLPDITLPDNGDTTYFINVLLNDYDPDGEAIRICEVKNRMGQVVSISYSDSTISLTMEKSNFLEYGFEYRVCEVNDSVSISNWATLIVNPGYKNNLLVLRNDTITCTRGYDVSVDVFANDYIGIGNDYYSVGVDDSGYIYHQVSFYKYLSYNKSYYLIIDTINDFEEGAFLFINYTNNEFYDSLTINNINASFNCNGNNFWNQNSIKPRFEVPKGSGISCFFNHTLWLTGLDENNQMHVAGEMFRSNQSGDFYHGPVATNYDINYDKRWIHIWNLKRTEIENHKLNWWKQDYEPIHDILTWPGNGNSENGESLQIAPFEDHNNNGLYEPMSGEAPIIRGDQALYYVFNDHRFPHAESGGRALGAEIRVMAYAFDVPEDSALWNTVFVHYDIINRSDTTYHDVYAAINTEGDLGYPWDDFVQCDVERGMYFYYNGDFVDDLPFGYGNSPPATGVQFLAGPIMEPDGADNPKFDISGNQICDESINGLNFGDAIADNERIGFTNFIIFNGTGPWGYPNTASDYFNFSRSYWRDGSPCIYGGHGHPDLGGLGPACKYKYPGDSDPCNWGTNGILPNGGYNQNGLYWTEEQIENNPSDRHGVGSSGPFSFAPGDVQSLDVAYVWARAYDGNPWSSVEVLKERASYIKDMFENNETFFSGVLENEKTGIRLWPNPAKNTIRIELPAKVEQAEYAIYNMQGQQLLSGKVHATKEIETDVSALQKGLYIYRVNTGSSVFVHKFMKQ